MVRRCACAALLMGVDNVGVCSPSCFVSALTTARSSRYRWTWILTVPVDAAIFALMMVFWMFFYFIKALMALCDSGNSAQPQAEVRTVAFRTVAVRRTRVADSAPPCRRMSQCRA